MNKLQLQLPVSDKLVGEELKQTVNARALHKQLCVGKVFGTWITDKIAKYDFVDGIDFVTVEDLSFPNSGSSKSRPQRLKEYHLTVDMAKELAMVENNDQGKVIRRYFIEVEKLATQNAISEAMRIAGEEAEKARREREAFDALPPYEKILLTAIKYRDKAILQDSILRKVMPNNIALYGTTDEKGVPYIGVRRGSIVRAVSRLSAAAELDVQMKQLELTLMLTEGEK